MIPIVTSNKIYPFFFETMTSFNCPDDLQAYYALHTVAIQPDELSLRFYVLKIGFVVYILPLCDHHINTTKN